MVRAKNDMGELAAVATTSGDAVVADDLAARLSAFSKGLFVLETMIDAAIPLSLSALVDRTGLPKTTVHRFVSVLVERGWAKETGRGYGLGYLPLRAAASLES